MYTENYDDFTVRHKNRADVHERRRDDIARTALGKTARMNRRQINRRHKELNNRGLVLMEEQKINSFVDIPNTDRALQDLALDRLQEIAELTVNSKPD